MAKDLHLPGNVMTFTWANTGAKTNVAPDTDHNIDISGAATIAIQVDLTHASNTSNDWDTNIHTSPDKTNWDTVAYASDTAAADGTIHTFLVTPGPKWLRLRGDNNTAASTGYVTARLVIIG